MKYRIITVQAPLNEGTPLYTMLAQRLVPDEEDRVYKEDYLKIESRMLEALPITDLTATGQDIEVTIKVIPKRKLEIVKDA